MRAGLLGQRAVAAAEEAVDGSADALSAQALDLAQRSGNPQTELEAVAARHLVLSYPQAIDERARLAERAIHLGRSSTTTMGALWGHLWQADIVLQRGELARLDDVLAEIERVAQQRASPVARWHVHRMLALRASLTGAFEPARRHALDGMRIAQRVGDVSMLGMYYAFCQHLALLRGDPDEVPREVLALLTAAPEIPLIQASRAMDLILRSDHEAATASFEALREVPDRMPLGPRWAGTVSQIGVVAALLHDAPVAERCYRLMAPCARWCGGDGGGSPFGQGSNENFLGVMAQTFGDVAAAAGHFERALAVDIRLGARPSVGLDRLGWAECLSAEPRLVDRADPGSPTWRELAEAAASEFRRLDMPGPLARAEHLLTTPPRTQRPAFGLTPRETEVAQLVAQALTNRQIADRLFLSERTVESHVRSVLAKRGLTTRTEAAVWVRGQDAP